MKSVGKGEAMRIIRTKFEPKEHGLELRLEDVHHGKY